MMMIIIWMWIKGLVRGRYGSEVSKGLHDAEKWISLGV